jgi:uncharacterized membrane protein
MVEETNQPIKENKETNTKGKNTGMAILAYFIFFIPLLTDAKKDPFVKFHVKQGLVLFIGWILVGVISSFLPWGLWMIVRLLDLALFILMIMGIITASKGQQKPLPIIGKFGEQFKF